MRFTKVKGEEKMQIDQIKELYEYNHWANERLWQAIEGLNEDQLKSDIHNGIGSILTTLLHMVNAVWTWRTRWQGGMPINVLRIEDFPDLQAVRTRWLGKRKSKCKAFSQHSMMKVLSKSFVISVPQHPTRYSPNLSGRCSSISSIIRLNIAAKSPCS